MHVLTTEEEVRQLKATKSLEDGNGNSRLVRILESPLGKLAVVALLFSLKHLSKLLRDKPKWFVDVLNTRTCGWAIENICVWSLNYIRSFIPSPTPLPTHSDSGEEVPLSLKIKIILRNIALSMSACVASEVGTIFVLHVLNQSVYNHVDYFNPQRKSDNPFRLGGFRDWLRGNALLQILGGGVALGTIESFLPARFAKDIDTAPKFSVLRFMRNFAFFRVVADVVFYVSHRLMHSHPRIYQIVHKWHHGHYTTNLTTNFHFTALDLFIESAVPMFCGMAALRALGVRMGRFELHLLMGHTAWYELGTHLGKPLPIISMFPPLSFLYNRFYDIDKDAVKFHDRHHNLRHCNYGITPWLDRLLGTEQK